MERIYDNAELNTLYDDYLLLGGTMSACEIEMIAFLLGHTVEARLWMLIRVQQILKLANKNVLK